MRIVGVVFFAVWSLFLADTDAVFAEETAADSVDVADSTRVTRPTFSMAPT
jgi:hypothetical protein